MGTINYKQIFYFLVSAGLTSLLYIGILYLMANTLKVTAYLSVTIAYGAAMLFYYLTNKFFVFKAKTTVEKSSKHQVLKFIIMIIVNYFLTLGIVALFKVFTHEIYSGSVAAGIITTILAYVVFARIFK